VIEADLYYDVDMHNWKDALQIQLPPNAKFSDSFEIYWIQAVAAARLDRPVEARASLGKFRQSLAEWRESQGPSWDAVWGPVFSVALTEDESWTMLSEGKDDEAVTRLKTAVQYERDHPMYYADVLPRPVSEMLGDMLLQMGRSTEALAAYKAALDVAPNRLDSLLGARTAAAKSGNAQLSDEYAERIRKEGGLIISRP